MYKALLLTGLAYAALACASPAQLDSQEATAGLLTRTREATARSAWESLEGALKLTGTADFNGTSGSYSMTLFPDGRYRQELGGPLGILEVFDGTRVYRRDASGVTRELALASRDDAMSLPAMLSGSWLAPSSNFELASRGGVFEVDMGPVAGERTTDFVLELDAETGLPTRIVDQGSGGAVITTMADWKETCGLLAPHTIRVEEGGGPVSEMRVLAAELVTGTSSLSMDHSPPKDVRFDLQLPTAIEVKRVPSGHLLVHPSIDGKDMGWFILDSGAGAMVIDPGVADELDMEVIGEVLATGIGGSEQARFRTGKSFELGPMIWDDQVYVELELTFLTKAFGIPIAGIVGYDFFSRAVVEVDSDKQRVTILNPAIYTEGYGGSVTSASHSSSQPWTPLIFDGHTASVMASFQCGDEVRTEPFRLDTGADGTLAFHTPAVARLGLMEASNLKRISMGGVGGSGVGYETTIPWFELGGHRFEEPTVTLAQVEIGVFTDEYSTGNIGQGFLSHFILVFDYQRNRMMFVVK